MWGVFLSIRKVTWKVCTTAPVESILHVRMMSYQEEPFSLWTNWVGQYSPESPERQLLEGIEDTHRQVNVTFTPRLSGPGSSMEVLA